MIKIDPNSTPCARYTNKSKEIDLISHIAELLQEVGQQRFYFMELCLLLTCNIPLVMIPVTEFLLALNIEFTSICYQIQRYI